MLPFLQQFVSWGSVIALETTLLARATVDRAIVIRSYALGWCSGLLRSYHCELLLDRGG